jgi:hypothetical protein
MLCFDAPVVSHSAGAERRSATEGGGRRTRTRSAELGSHEQARRALMG